jgi:hypothetical protein
MTPSPYPWNQTTNSTEDSQPLEKSAPKGVFQEILKTENLKKIGPWMVLLALLTFLIASRSKSESRLAPQEDSLVTVLVSMIPIQKGTPIVPQALKEIAVPKQTFSRLQKMSLLQINDIGKSTGQWLAAKNIPPRKPIFWADLKSPSKETSIQKQHAITIQYSEEK